MAVDTPLDNDVRTLEHVTVGAGLVHEGHVGVHLVEHPRGIRSQRRLCADDRRQLFVLHPDVTGGVVGDVAVRCEHRRDRMTLIANLDVGEQPERRQVRRKMVDADMGDVGRGHHLHAVSVGDGRHIEAGDAPVSHG